jgi:hypothetical protein
MLVDYIRSGYACFMHSFSGNDVYSDANYAGNILSYDFDRERNL